MTNIFSKKTWKFRSATATSLEILSILFSLVWLLLTGFENPDEYEEQYYTVIN